MKTTKLTPLEKSRKDLVDYIADLPITNEQGQKLLELMYANMQAVIDSSFIGSQK